MHASKSLVLGLAASALALSAAPASAELMYATNGTVITRFDTAALGVTTTVPVTGLQSGETLVGIDTRPANQLVYGIGSSSRVYSINPLTGVAVQVGSAGAFTLNGTAFGTDFNPVPDRIRQISNTEQNLRLNPNDGTLAATDTTLNPAGNIVGAAYDRNYARGVGDTTPTTLYGIDSAAGTLVTIGSVNGTPNSPNAGQITTVGSLGLGTNLNENIGFDISGLTANGLGASASNLPIGTAYASITTGGISRLYTINLATGAATLVSSNAGTIGSGTSPFLGLTAANAPEPATGLLAATGVALLIRRRTRRV